MTTKQKELIETKGWDNGAVEAYLLLGIGDDDLDNFEEAYCGEWKNDVDFVKDLLENEMAISEKLPPYVHIDWESTVRDIMMDYSEEGGYYFRNF